MTKQFDILIVGGGIVGATLACLLARQTRLSIAVLEAKSQPDSFDTSTYHHRVSAITLASKRIFKTAQVWDSIYAKRVSPFTSIEVWNEGEARQIAFNSSDIAESVLGYIIENNLIQIALNERMALHSQITYLPGKTLKAILQTETYLQVTTEGGEVLHCQLAVAADGGNSLLRQLSQFEIIEKDYAETAIVATVETALPHASCARQVFLKTGPLAHLPLNQTHTSSIVWTLAQDEARAMLESDEAHFKEKLAQAFSYRLGEVLKLDKPYAFPLRKQTVKQYVKPRIALVGDAAHTIHPLAGQGVNMGLLDAASLVEVIAEACSMRRDFASMASLRRYERWRKADNLGLMNGIDIIREHSIRKLGFHAVDYIPWLKQFFIRHAVGNRLGLPAFIREN